MHTISNKKQQFVLKHNTLPIKIRKSWGMFVPTSRIHQTGKKQGYNRQHEQRNWQLE